VGKLLRMVSTEWMEANWGIPTLGVDNQKTRLVHERQVF